MRHIKTTILQGVGLAILLLNCKNDTKAPSGCNAPAPECEECEPGAAYACECWPANNTPTEAWEPPHVEAKIDACEGSGCSLECPGEIAYTVQLGCPPPTEPASYCSTWDPGAKIYGSSSPYSIDISLITDAYNDYRPLLYCDSAGITYTTVDGFEVENAVAGDTIYELGLRNGDKFVTVNGLPLSTMSEVLHAVGILWFFYGETSYELEIERASSPVTLEYSIIVV